VSRDPRAEAGADRPRLAVRVTPDALRQLRGGHPWLYADAITSIGDGGRAGDLAVVFDERRRFAAIGLYDPDSPIRVKVLHHGRPVAIDRAWWRDRVAAARDRRGALVTSTDTTGWRVVHGENDGLPGLVVDRYGDTAVVKLYSAALLPHLAAVRAAVVAALTPARIVLRASRLVAPALPPGHTDGTTVDGPAPDGPVAYRELGLALTADVVHGQKTGAFLDQRDNRDLVARHAAGARVLDVFSCTGGFALHAARGGARSAHLVDQSAGAIATARANRERNLDDGRVAACGFTSDVGDAFDVLAALGRSGARFEVVVVDPPSFAANRAAVGRALAAYRRLTALALPLVAPGGVLFQASCSSRVTAADFVAAVHAEAAASGVRVHELARTGQPIDHPVGFPQGAYLKALLLRPDRRDRSP
jgi:23S rRNA (cytosine1962-C5)-methyltransferase